MTTAPSFFPLVVALPSCARGARNLGEICNEEESLSCERPRYFLSRYNIYEAMHHDQQWLITPSSKKNHPRRPPARARSLARRS